MASIRRKIKEVLSQKWVPSILFEQYFNFQNNKKRQQLLAALNSDTPLIDLIGKGEKAHWSDRINEVTKCPDNKDIEYHQQAGQIIDGHIIMHNGLKLDPASYYGYGMLELLLANKGVHEPQEEKLFQEVLKVLPKDSKKTMLELGAYWSFYSLWFLKMNPTAACYMVEPERLNLFYGKQNANINKLKGNFIHAGIGDKESSQKNVTTVDAICKRNNIEFLDILHADIQGFELDMLKGSKKMLSENRVGYIFISTHSNELHEDCYQHLQNKYNFELVASANLDESYSWDGILLMKNPNYTKLGPITITKRNSVKTAKKST